LTSMQAVYDKIRFNKNISFQGLIVHAERILEMQDVLKLEDN